MTDASAPDCAPPRAQSRSFGSCCHGAGRQLSRTKARERAKGRDSARELAKLGISLQAAGRATVEEEISEAYKDVIDVVVRAGLRSRWPS